MMVSYEAGVVSKRRYTGKAWKLLRMNHHASDLRMCGEMVVRHPGQRRHIFPGDRAVRPHPEHVAVKLGVQHWLHLPCQPTDSRPSRSEGQPLDAARRPTLTPTIRRISPARPPPRRTHPGSRPAPHSPRHHPKEHPHAPYYFGPYNGGNRMRMMLRVSIPVETGNAAIRNGTIGSKIQSILAELKLEAAYFTDENGCRSALIIFDMKDTSEIPAVVEPR